MAYNFLIEKTGDPNLLVVHQRLTELRLIEFFPVEVSSNYLALGMSIPFKSVSDPQFKHQLEVAMAYLITEQGFLVTDLYTGKAIATSEISGLAAQISA